jgi:hypothetical protein
MAHFDPEVDRVVSIAKAMRARGVIGFDVENEHTKCGVTRVYMGISARDGRQIVHEFDRSRPEERPVTGPADVLSGIAVLSPYAPGWKTQANGGIDWN